MIRTSLLLLSACLLLERIAANSISRQLQLNEKWWAIGDPDFNYDDSQFSFKWTVSDYIADGNAAYSVYDGTKCKEGNKDITEAMNNYRDIATGAFLQNLGLQPDSATPYDPLNPNRGDGFRDMRLFLDVQPTLANTDLLYYESDNQNRAVVDFCVRFSLYNIDHRDEDAIEVNFQETIVTFYIDLTDGFQIGNVNVQEREKFEKTAFIDCEIIAYECDNDKIALQNPGFLRNQGSETRVCVELAQESKDQGLYLDRILWFYFIREDPREVKQWSIVMDSEQSPDELTEFNCMRGEDICAFNTILRADFYAWQGVGIVQGIGLGLCMLSGGTWLVEDRKRTVGEDLAWMQPEQNVFGSVNELTITGFPLGTTVEYTDTQNNFFSTVVSDGTFAVVLGSGDPFSNLEEPEIRDALNTLALQAPPHSDVDFDLDVIVKVGESVHRYRKPVAVFAVADTPAVIASEYLVLNEDDVPLPLRIIPQRSADDDNSETLSVEITLPSDDVGAIGSIVELSKSSTASIEPIRGGTAFLVQATGATPATREANLAAYTNTNLAFQPRANWAGELEIIVEAVSTEANDVAMSNSIAHDTLGDFDTRTERAQTIIPVRVLPVVDLPYMKRSRSVVAENNLNSNVDEDVVVRIGERMGVTVDDLDGSQTFQAVLVGFPTNAIDLRFGRSLPDVTATVNRTSGIVSIQSTNTEGALLVLESLQITLFTDDDSNFLIEMTGRCTDKGGSNLVVEADFYLSHQVIVQAVADTPTLDAGMELKSAEAEGVSAFRSYPVTVALNDKDGSETYESVNITLSTSTAITTRGLQPEVNFSVLPAGVIVTRQSGNPAQIVLQGLTEDVEIAMQNLQIRPGYQNGEDINVTVTAAAMESHPSELGPDEVAVLRVKTVGKFMIPVNPRIEGEPTLTLGVSAPSGNEDTTISLGTFAIRVNGTVDADGSETPYLEISTSSFPVRTKFFVNGIEQQGLTLLDSWLQLTVNQTGSSSFSIRPPPNFSGEIDILLRARVVDYTTTGNVEKLTASVPLKIKVFPVADGITQPTATTVGIEDLGPVQFGNTLANTKLSATDKGGVGNNPEPETFQQIVVTVPQDRTDMTYTMSGQYVPTASGSFGGFGTAQVSFNQTTRVYKITSTTITTAANVTTLTQQQRQQSMDDILDTLETFKVEMGPAHTDKDGQLNISVTTLDVNLGRASTRANDFIHTIKIQAVADTPSMVVSPVSAIDEDSSLPLRIQAVASADVDGSELTFLRIVVSLDAKGKVPGKIKGLPPAGVVLEELLPNVYVVTSSGTTVEQRITLLNSFINNPNGEGLTFSPSQHWSGKTTLAIQVVSMEQANGSDLAPVQYGGADRDSKRETVTQYLDIVVNPKADTPSITFSANSRGDEDTKIRVFVGVTTEDVDGSETYVLRIDNDLPAGAKLFGASDTQLQVGTDGQFILSPDDVSALSILPPLHWSSARQGDIVLILTAVVTDTSVFGTTDIASTTSLVPVVVVGVADKPTSRQIIVQAVEDQDYLIGQYIGNLDSGILVDTDGSETLSFMIGGLPDKVQLKTNNNTGITYIGGGRYQVDKQAMPSLRVTPVLNFAGMNPYPGMFLRAVTQEIEGDQAVSDNWPIIIKVQPVVDSIDWSMSLELTEADNEIRGVGVSFASALNYTMNDDDGSEAVQELYIDLSSFITDAKVGQRLNNLIGGSSLSNLIRSNLIQGPFTFNDTTGVLTVAPNAVNLVKLKAAIFLDSNVGFSIPISAKVVDSVQIDGTTVSDSTIQEGIFVVKLTGTADVPTVFADAEVSGGTRIPISVGGLSTDTDVALGREPSERIHYFITALNLGGISNFQFVDSSNSPVGFDGGENTWFLLPEDVDAAVASGGLFFAVRTPSNSSETAIFNFTAVATENDGDVATKSVNFTVNYVWQGGPITDIAPLAPLVTIGTHQGIEDIDLPFDILVEADPNDTTNPKLSVVFKANSIPQGSSMQGAFYPNLKTGHFVAKAEDIANGEVLLRPTKDFGGDMSITIEALAVNGSFRYASSGLRTVNLYFDPVADGVSMGLPDIVSNENAQVTLSFTFATKDIDGSENLGDMVYVKLCPRVSFIQAFENVKVGDSDANFNGTSTIGYSRVSLNRTGAIKVQPDFYWHGPCEVDVIALSIESEDDQDGDYRMASSESFTLTVLAVPTPANLTAPAAVEVDEGAYVGFPGLSADYVDKIPENGYETLSLFVSNVPEDSLFSQGTNVGDGVWSFSGQDVLGSLTFRPPLYFSGNFSLMFRAITRESSAAGQEAEVTKQTLVSVKPVASPFLMVAEDVQAAKGNVTTLKLNVRMEDNVTLPGETSLESIRLTFSSVPDKVVLLATSGGSINATGNLTWVFQGTEAQANALRFNVSSLVATGLYDIGVSGITRDGSSVLTIPNSDVFRLTVTAVGTVRHLQDAFDSVFVTDLPTELCMDPIDIAGDDKSRITVDMFTLLDKRGSTLDFRFSPDFEPSDNFIGIMFSGAPIGVPSYPVILPGDAPLTLTSNCYANEAFFYVFVNSDRDVQSQALVPNTFDALTAADRTTGFTELFKVTLPCSPCQSADIALEQMSRGLQKSRTPRLHKALAASLSMRSRRRRNLQQLANGQGEIRMEITMDVPPKESAAMTLTRPNFVLATAFTLAAVLVSYLL